MAWLQETDSGDRAELLLLPEEQPAWNKLAEHEGACVASQCVFQKRGQCFLFRARRQAESAHIVVVNHALLLSDLGTDGGVLPPYQHLIIDEAHHLEAEATRQFGFEIDAARLVAHLDQIRPPAGARGDGSGRGPRPAAPSVGALAELRARLNVTKGAAAREAKKQGRRGRGAGLARGRRGARRGRGLLRPPRPPSSREHGASGRWLRPAPAPDRAACARATTGRR